MNAKMMPILKLHVVVRNFKADQEQLNFSKNSEEKHADEQQITGILGWLLPSSPLGSGQKGKFYT